MKNSNRGLINRVLAVLLAVAMVINFFPANQKWVMAETVAHPDTFTFTVRDGAGTILQGATVTVQFNDTVNGVQTEAKETDAKGEVAFDSITSNPGALESMDVSYSVSKYGYSDIKNATITVSDTAAGAKLWDANVDASITAYAKKTISGTVSFGSAKIKDATVKLSGYGGDKTMKTPVNGTFSFADVYDNGSGYTLTISDTEYKIKTVVASLTGSNSITLEEKAPQTGFAFGSTGTVNITVANMTIENAKDWVYTNTASGPGTGNVSYKITNDPYDVADIDETSGKLTIKKTGTVVVGATKEEDGDYKSATAGYTLKITKADQTGFAFDAATPAEVGLETKVTLEILAAGGEGTGGITYEVVSGSNIASIGGDNNRTIMFKNVSGSFEIKATKAADNFYKEISTVFTMEVVAGVPPTDPFKLTVDDEIIDSAEWNNTAIKVELKEEYKALYKICFYEVPPEDAIWEDALYLNKEGKNNYKIKLKVISTNLVTDPSTIYDIKIDKTSPNKLNVSYDQSVREVLLEALSFGFYKAKVKVTLTAEDSGSKVTSFAYEYADSLDASAINKGELVAITSSTNETVATASFEIESEFRGKVSFTATDKVGNTSEKFCDNKTIVVDTTSPTTKITYNTPVQMIDNKTKKTVTSVTEDTKFIYNGNIEANIEIVEANFFEGSSCGNNEYINDVKVVVKREDEAGIHETIYVPYPTTDPTKKQIAWKSEDDKHTSMIELTEEGDYSISIEYKDMSDQKMTSTSPQENKESNYSYLSNQLSIDVKKPTISVAYDNNIAMNTNNFKADRTATIVIKEHNFRAEEVDVSMSASDIQGNAVTGFNTNAVSASLKKAESWTETLPNVWTAQIGYSLDAQYTFDISYTDTAGNVNEPVDYGKEASLGKLFKLDKTAPDNQKFTVKYSRPLKDAIISAITFGYYNVPVTATITAEDFTSGIDSFTYSYTVQAGTSAINTGKANITIPTGAILYSDQGKTATATFQIPAQFYGSVKFMATDKAGNKSKEFNAKEVVVVDDISPTRSVTYSKPSQIVDEDTLLSQKSEDSNSILYYSEEAKVTFTINEANFDAKEVDIRVSKNEGTPYEAAPIDWKQEGDVWTGTRTLSGDGAYVITMTYIDKSSNRMTSFTSKQLVVDTISPTIAISYSGGKVIKELDNHKYYNTLQTATITMKEHNFRADDVAAVVTAKDVAGTDLVVTNYTAFLSNRDNWTKNGDSYSAKISYAVDANYTFDVSYVDLAKNKAADFAEEEFTVDKTAPKNLTVSYSDHVFKEVLQSITFGYYKAPVTVTITAEDDTSGIDSFQYSYVNSAGESVKNAQLLDQSIGEKKITYSANGKKASATFSIPKAALTGSNQFKGNVEFTAVDKSSGETEHAETKNTIIVDSIAPNAEVSYNDPTQTIEDISYYGGEVKATFKITEANFKAENISVMVSKNGAESYAKAPSDWTQKGDEWTGSIALLAPEDHSGDGDYVIVVTYTDKSNNEMAVYTSKQLTIDTIMPTIEITGLKNKSANKEATIGFTITSTDVNFGTITPKLAAVVLDSEGRLTNSNIPMGERKTITNGTTYAYSIENLDVDGIYTLDCSVVDLAGNTNETLHNSEESKEYNQVTFSVNRKGSSFALNNTTKALVGDYYVQNVKDDIIISEVNVDPLAQSIVELNKKVLIKDVDYTVEVLSGSNNWNEYQYKVKSNLFQEEGEYSVVVNSTDKTGTSAYSDIKSAEILFVVDRTIPEAAISGMKQGGRYQTEAQTVTIVPKDPGGKLNSVKVILNDSETVVDVSGDQLEAALSNNKDKISFDIPSGMEQTVKINCIDEAGNESKQSIGKITVSNQWYILYYANKPFFYGSIAGVTTMVIALAAWFMLKKKKIK